MTETDAVQIVEASQAETDDALQAEQAGTYMDNVWLPEGPLYALRRTGGGETVLRHGDVIEDILMDRIYPPAGPLWVPSYRLARLSPDVIEQLLAKGVTEIKVIPETTGDEPFKHESIE